ncbi:unnamed protein product, partial [Closterium sp. NIES-54]
VSGVLIPRIPATRRQLRERFSWDIPVLRLHSDRGGEFYSDLLAEFCRDEGIHQSLTLPASPQKNGIAERRIGLIMELNLWPCVFKPETSPTLRWTGKVGDASVFRVWGALSLVRDANPNKLSSCTLRCVFLGFPTNAPSWQFYYPRECRVFSSQDITFDESGPTPSGVSQVDPPPLVEPLEISSDSSSLAEGVYPAADDMAAARRSPRLETPPGAARARGAAGAGGAGGATGAAGARGAGAAGAGGAEAAGSAPHRLFFYPQLQSSLPPPDLVIRQPPDLSEPPASSLPYVLDPKSDLDRAASPTVTRLLATVVTNLDLESTAAFALVTELVDFAVRSRLHYVASLVTESEFVCPSSVRGEPALSSDVLEDRQFELECLAAALPRFVSMLLARMHLTSLPRALTPRRSWGVDFFQTFSPTPKMTTLRVLLHVAAQRDYKLHSLDFSTAFMQGSLHKEIWLRGPPGFTRSFPAGTQWSLHRPVYGLRQAPQEWHVTLRTTLAALGFAPSTADPSLFLCTDTTLPPFYVLVYVEDLVFATADTEVLTLVKAELHERHTCTDLGEMRSYHDLQITWDRARCTITLTQSHMVDQVLQCFRFQFSSPQPTPLSTGHSLSAPPLDESVEPSGPYPEHVGCLMYLMTCIRPDLTYPLSLLARYVAPGRHRKVHLHAAKRALRYLCSTLGMGQVHGGQGSVVLTGHSDTSWADDQVTQGSSQGYTFSLGSDSFSWRSTRSSSVLGSNCEAEIYAGAWLHRSYAG